MRKFKDELRGELKTIQEQAEKARGANVDLRASHLSEEARQLEKETRHISEVVKEEIKKLDEVQ
jgi:hypothetical protein